MAPDDFDVINLDASWTGIEGVVQLSTAGTFDIPIVRFFQSMGREDQFMIVSIASDPKVTQSTFSDAITSQLSPMIVEYVRINAPELTCFWNEGAHWLRQDVDSFLRSLRRLGSV